MYADYGGRWFVYISIKVSSYNDCGWDEYCEISHRLERGTEYFFIRV